jgi:hypothetical protein
LGKLDLGLNAGVIPNILISGGGDGALQDFIRIATGFGSARELLVALAGGEETALRHRVHTAEDQMLRRSLWNSPGAGHCAILAGLDTAYRVLADDAAQQRGSLWSALERFLMPRVRDGVLRDGSIHVAHVCNHLSACYPLNHMLARLLMKFLGQIDAKRFRFLENTATQGVSSNNHICGSFGSCHGEEHEVVFAGKACAAGAKAPDEPKGSYNVIVIRHGVRRRDRTEPPRMQLLPYHLE